MQVERSRFALVPLLAVTLVFCAVSAWGATVSDYDGLKNALASNDITDIVISGDIFLNDPLSIDRTVTLRSNESNEGALVLPADYVLKDGIFRTSMITVEAQGVEMNDLKIGVESNDQEDGGDLWSLITVTEEGGLLLESCDLYGCPPEGTRTEAIEAINDDEIEDLRFALVGVHVQNGILETRGTSFNSLYLSGILLDSGTTGASVTDNEFNDCSIGIMTVHNTEEAYDDPTQAVSDLNISSNDFRASEIGIALLPNVESADILDNTFSESAEIDVASYADIVVLPVGVYDIQTLIEEGYRTDEEDFDAIHDLIEEHLALPDVASQTRDLSVWENNFNSGSTVGLALAGCSDRIMVDENLFGDGNPPMCGALLTGFPGQILGRLLDAVIDMDGISLEPMKTGTKSAIATAAAGHDFPDYPANATFTDNAFMGSTVGAIVAFNAEALFNSSVKDGQEENDMEPSPAASNTNLFVGNTLGLGLVNGPGSVTVEGQEFEGNTIALADIGYGELIQGGDDLSALDLTELLEENSSLAEIAEDLVEASNSTLVIQNCQFEINEAQEGIWILNDKVRANIRFNDFYSTAASSTKMVEAPGSLSGQAIDGPEDLRGYTSIRVGHPDLECNPERVSITENTFSLKTTLPAADEGDLPWSFVLFDIQDGSGCEYGLNLNTFEGLENFASPDSYAVVVSGDVTIDGTRNLWFGEEDTPLSADAVTDGNYVLGNLTVSPVFDDQSLADMPSELSLTSEDLGEEGTLYSGTSKGLKFTVSLPEGYEASSLFIRSVGEDEVLRAFTDAELEDIDLPGLFCLPLDIQVYDLENEKKLVLRFRNSAGITPEELIVKTTTPDGAYEWYTPFQNPAPEDHEGSRAYVSDDGEWIVLEFVGGSEPTLTNEMIGSVTVVGEPAGSSGGSSGSCSVGSFAPGALLLLLPLAGLLRR